MNADEMLIDLHAKMERVLSLEVKILSIVEKQAVKEWYSVKEASMLFGRSEWTVRNDWIKHQKINAQKIKNGKEWRIPHSEIERIQREGPNSLQTNV